MGNKLERYFDVYKIREDLKLSCIIEYENIERDLKEKTINLIDVKGNHVSKLVLPWVLMDKGYTYTGKRVLEEINKNDENSYIKIANLLEDIGLIEKPVVTEDNPFKDVKEFVFIKELGFFESFDIVYRCDTVPYNIKLVSNRLKKYINCKVINRDEESILRVNISVPRYENINNYEDIVIYSGFDVRHVPFIIRGESNHLIEGETSDRQELDETIITKVSKINNLEEIIELVKIAENESGMELPLNIYVKIFKAAFNLKEFNIRFAIFSEEYFLKHPILINGMLEYLREMYNKKILTSKSIDLIEYFKLALDESVSSKGAIINLKEYKREFDGEFINEVKKIYSLTNKKEIFDDVINKILNFKRFRFDDELVKIVWSFYRRTGDINALIKIVDNNEIYKTNLKGLEFKISDRIILIDFYKRNGGINFESIIKFCFDFIDESDYIKKSFVEIINKLFEEEDKEEVDAFFVKNDEVCRKLSNYNEKIYVKYLENKVKFDKEIDDIEFFEKAYKNMENKDKEIKLELLKRIVEYYICESNENKYIKYINLYLSNFGAENPEVFLKEIVNKYSFDVVFLGVFLNRVDFKELNMKLEFLEIISNAFILNKRFDLLPLVMKEYRSLKKCYESKKLFKIYIKKCKHITSNIYSSVIKSIFDILEEEEKRTTYIALMERSDFPIEFRVRYYELCKSEANKNIIVREFKLKKIESKKAKLLALIDNFNDDLAFMDLVKIGENNEEIRRVVLEKIISKFEDEKGYVKKLIENLGDKSKAIKDINSIIKEYFMYKDNVNLAYIYGNNKVVSRYRGFLCDRVKLKGIFDGEVREGFIFREDGLSIWTEKYFNRNNIEYKKFDDRCFVILDTINIEVEKSNKLFESFSKIVKIQKDLIKEGYCIVDFKNDAFSEVGEFGVFPTRLDKLIKYKEGSIIRKTELLKECLVLTEENLVKMMRLYFYNKLLKVKQNKYYNVELIDFAWNNLVVDDGIKSFRKLEQAIENNINQIID